MATTDNGAIRQFDSGATRDTSKNKLEPFGFISPLALFRFSEYMHKHRLQSDGSLRASDNWKKGMPIGVYVQSLIRHVFDFWLVMSGLRPRFDPHTTDPEEIACAILFNVQGFLHEVTQKGLDNPIREDGPAEAPKTMNFGGGMLGVQGRAWDFGPHVVSAGSFADGLPGVDKGLSDDVDRAFSKITNGASDEDWRAERAW